ncbi:hypothetical protein Ndes2526B_g08150 [Nannochloris sp. 'desiccata']|nr:hypothetical protein KSW81_002783 [Chlorella desiccata (nom. nud.)]KAH7617545.1 hypothetical protein NADE_007323 [Chlorella desiccata (nom. nud.)]
MVCKREFQDEIIINASTQVVYNQLTDLESYPQWNTVMPQVRIKKEHLQTGQKIKPTLVTSNGKIAFSASLSKVDPDHKEFRWVAKSPIPFFFKGEQFFKMVPAGENNDQTKFIRGSVYAGLMVPILSCTTLDKVDASIGEMVNVLKARVESIAHPPPPPPAAESSAATTAIETETAAAASSTI